jgi:hypothetical protein
VGLLQVNIVIDILLVYASTCLPTPVIFCVARFIAAAEVWRCQLAVSERRRSYYLRQLTVLIASFAGSQGATIGVYLSGIFATGIRSRAQSIGSATHWIFNALIAGGFRHRYAFQVRAVRSFASMMPPQFAAAFSCCPKRAERRRNE